MPPNVGIPRAPESDVRVRRALQAMTILNDLWLDGTLVLSGPGRGRLHLVDSQIPDTITRDTELTAAIAALKFTTPLFDYFADVATSNTDGTEDDLISSTLAAGQLASDGDKVSALYAGYWIGHATALRRLRAYFGGTAVLDTDDILISASAAWELSVTVIRVSASVVRISAVLKTEAAPQAIYTTISEITGLTLANTQILKITGTASDTGAASGDITAQLGQVNWTPAA